MNLFGRFVIQIFFEVNLYQYWVDVQKFKQEVTLVNNCLIFIKAYQVPLNIILSHISVHNYS